MIRDEELDAMLSTLCADPDDAELDRRTVRFRAALRRLRDEPAEATPADARANLSVVPLVTRATAGDPAAWATIVDRYTPLLWSICTRFQLSNQDREDVAQNVWLLLVPQLGKLREPAALPGWLATTTRRECLRVLAAARKPERREAGPEDSAAIDEEILTAERNAALRAAFAELPPRCQQLLAMLTSDPPSSYAQISAALQIPIGSIGPQRARCLNQLRKSVTKQGA